MHNCCNEETGHLIYTYNENRRQDYTRGLY